MEGLVLGPRYVEFQGQPLLPRTACARVCMFSGGKTGAWVAMTVGIGEGAN